MKSLNFYTFEERVPIHGDQIIVIDGEGRIWNSSVSYPSVKHPNKFKEDYYEINGVGGLLKECCVYCTSQDLLELSNKIKKGV